MNILRQLVAASIIVGVSGCADGAPEGIEVGESEQAAFTACGATESADTSVTATQYNGVWELSAIGVGDQHGNHSSNCFGNVYQITGGITPSQTYVRIADSAVNSEALCEGHSLNFSVWRYSGGIWIDQGDSYGNPTWEAGSGTCRRQLDILPGAGTKWRVIATARRWTCSGASCYYDYKRTGLLAEGVVDPD